MQFAAGKNQLFKFSLELEELGNMREFSEKLT